MKIEEEIIKEFEAAANCKYNDDARSLILSAMQWTFDYLEKNRKTACDNMTQEEYEREQKFVVEFLKKNYRTPTFSDCIEITRKEMIDRVRDWLKVNAYKYGKIKIVGEGLISFDLRTDSLIKDMDMVI